MRSVLEYVGVVEAPRRRAATRPRKDLSRRFSAVESLERREVLSGAGVPLATIPSVVSAKGDVAHVVVHFDAGQLTSDRSPSILLGLYARPTTGSTLVPNISEVDVASGRLTRANIPQRGTATAAKALFIASVPLGTGQAQDISVDVTGLNGKTGNFDLEVFLPGDANGDGLVNATDLTIIQGVYGSASGQANFNPSADFNADGHVGCVDRLIAEENQGAHAAYTPVTVQAAAVVAPVVTPTVAPAVAAPATPAPAPTPAPVVTTQTVTTTPVVTAQAVTATPVVVTPVQTTAQVATVQATPVVVAPLQTAPAATPVYAPTAAAVPVYAVPTTQAAAPTYVQAAPGGYYPANATAPVYYYSGQPVAPSATNTVSLNSQAPMPGVVYYYGQPVVQAPAFGQAISNQATTTTTTPNVVYYGQQVVPAPAGYTPQAAPNVVYYYGQPTSQVTTTSQTTQA